MASAVTVTTLQKRTFYTKKRALICKHTVKEEDSHALQNWDGLQVSCFIQGMGKQNHHSLQADQFDFVVEIDALIRSENHCQ